MLVRSCCVLTFCVLAGAAAFSAAAGEAAQGSEAADAYEARLDELSREVLQIRRELETILSGVVAPETGRILVLLENPPARWRVAGVSLAVDGKTVFSRPFTPAEVDVLERGLPLELVDLRLPTGERRVTLSQLGGSSAAPVTLVVPAGGPTSWIAQGDETAVRWRSE